MGEDDSGIDNPPFYDGAGIGQWQGARTGAIAPTLQTRYDENVGRVLSAMSLHSMKTTIELSETIYSQIAASAIRQGISIDEFVEDAICDRLAKEPQLAGGWRSVFGKGDKEAVAEVQRIIDEEFPNHAS